MPIATQNDYLACCGCVACLVVSRRLFGLVGGAVSPSNGGAIPGFIGLLRLVWPFYRVCRLFFVFATFWSSLGMVLLVSAR